MKNFQQIAAGVDVMPLSLELHRQTHLWDKNPCRLSKKGPHHETQDIFLRFNDEIPCIKSGDWSKFNDLHIADWYESIDHLPSAKKLIFDLMATVKGEVLGGVFIYRLKPGTKIYPHEDHSWHADFMDKFNICLQSNPAAAFIYEDEMMIQRPGDVHHFNNAVTHSVVNNGPDDHIVMTVCIRLDRGYRVPWSPEGWTMDKSKGR